MDGDDFFTTITQMSTDEEVERDVPARWVGEMHRKIGDIEERAGDVAFHPKPVTARLRWRGRWKSSRRECA